MTRGEPDVVLMYLETLARLGHRLADRAAIFEARGWTEEGFGALEAEALGRLDEAAREGRSDRLVAFARTLVGARMALLAGVDGPEPETEARPTARSIGTLRSDAAEGSTGEQDAAAPAVDPTDFMTTLHSPRRP